MPRELQGKVISLSNSPLRWATASLWKNLISRLTRDLLLPAKWQLHLLLWSMDQLGNSPLPSAVGLPALKIHCSSKFYSSVSSWFSEFLYLQTPSEMTEFLLQKFLTVFDFETQTYFFKWNQCTMFIFSALTLKNISKKGLQVFLCLLLVLFLCAYPVFSLYCSLPSRKLHLVSEGKKNTREW